MCAAAGWSAGSVGSFVTLHRKLCSISCAACAAHWAARPDGGASGTLPDDDGSRAEFARSIGECAPRSSVRARGELPNREVLCAPPLLPPPLCDQVIRENPASRGTEASADVLVGPPGRMVSNARRRGPVGHSARSTLGQTHASRKTKGKIEVPEERSF